MTWATTRWVTGVACDDPAPATMTRAKAKAARGAAMAGPSQRQPWWGLRAAAVKAEMAGAKPSGGRPKSCAAVAAGHVRWH